MDWLTILGGLSGIFAIASFLYVTIMVSLILALTNMYKKNY